MAKTRRQAKPKVRSSRGQGGRPAAGDGQTVSGYFRKIFKARPSLLWGKSNAEVLERWQHDHPGEDGVPTRIKQSLSNIKSVLRHQGRKKRGRRPAGAPTATTATPGRKLETLEEYIDECLTMAKNLGRDKLEDVIKLLRRARNEVVWKLGQ